MGRGVARASVSRGSGFATAVATVAANSCLIGGGIVQLIPVTINEQVWGMKLIFSSSRVKIFVKKSKIQNSKILVGNLIFGRSWAKSEFSGVNHRKIGS